MNKEENIITGFAQDSTGFVISTDDLTTGKVVVNNIEITSIEDWDKVTKSLVELQKQNKELHNKVDKAIEYMNGEEFFLLMNSIQTPDKAVCEDYFKAKGNLLEILKGDVDE